MLKASLPLLLSTLAALPAAALDLSRANVRSFVDEMSREHGFERATVEALLGQAETKQPILDAISRPAERVVPWYEYRERFLTGQRIAQGAQFWAEHAARLARIDRDELAAAVVGILGVETSYGRITGRYRVIDALATLAFDYPPRGEFFRTELREFLMLSREEHVDPASALGSYAGAMGAPQFISSSYRRYAVDGDGNGRRDLWNSWDDVIDSVANYLTAHGWRAGEPVVADATLIPATAPDTSDAATANAPASTRSAAPEPDLSLFDTSTLELNETVGSLRKKGVRFETRLPADAPAMLIVAQGKDGPVLRVGFNNFYVITRYNRSTMYAMAVHELGAAVQDAMRAGLPLDGVGDAATASDGTR